MDAKDRTLDALQVNGDWMTFIEIQNATGIVSLTFLDMALRDFVGLKVVELEKKNGKKRWRAIMERMR
jgi:DNA-binding transcriptional regulator GbsR (MarR family)